MNDDEAAKNTTISYSQILVLSPSFDYQFQLTFVNKLKDTFYLFIAQTKLI